jgi:hypothetical protein
LIVGSTVLFTGEDLLLPPDSCPPLAAKLRGLVGPEFGESVDEVVDDGRDSMRVGMISGVGEEVWRAGSTSIVGFSDA